MMNQDKFSNLLLDIYKASAVSMHWQSVLEQFTSYIEGSKAVLTRRSNLDGHIDVKNLQNSKVHNIEKYYLEEYINGLYLHDIWTPIEIKHKVGELCIFSEHLSISELRKQKYFIEWLRPQNISDGIAIQLYKNDVFRIVLNVIYNHEANNQKKLHDDLRVLTPHLCQSVELWIASLSKDDSCYASVNSDYLEKRYGLTPREAEIANLSARLGTNKKIADTLHLAESTIKSHFESIKKKMNVQDKHEVMLIATGFVGSSKNT